MSQPWHCKWADTQNSPDEASLESWTLSKWLNRKAVDIQQCLADANHTLALIGEHDELIGKCRRIEEEIWGYLVDRFPVDVPVLSNYKPRMIDAVWIGSRVQELERQRDRFSTVTYWKKDKPDPTLANKALNLVTTAIGRYTIISTQDWRGVVDALQEYTDELERVQLTLVVARNFQSFDNGAWSGPVARLAKRVRSDMRGIHLKIVEDMASKYPALQVHPWRIDEGLERMTTEEYRLTPLSHWDADRTGPPCLIDGPIFEEGSTITFEQLLDRRRFRLDDLLEEFRPGRFSIVKGLIRRERKAWGKAQMAIAQFKRWGVWPE